MKSIDIVLSTGEGWISRAIRKFTKKEYSHVAIRFRIRDWGYMYYHADGTRVNYMNGGLYAKENSIKHIYPLAVSDELFEEVLHDCWKDAGAHYSNPQLLGNLIWDFFQKYGWRVSTSKLEEGWICSELVYLKLLKKLVPELDENANYVTPEDCKLIVEEYFKLDEESGLWVRK